MMIRSPKLLSLMLVMLLTGLLVACGGSSNKKNSDDGDNTPDPTPTAQVITGTAATGAAIDGFVYLADRNGQPGDATPFTINADGSFSIDVTNFLAPFILKAVPNDNSATQFSYAAQAGVTNITPLTTLALFEATQRADVAALFNGWAQHFSSVDAATLQQTATAIATSLQAQFTANGVNVNSFNLFTTPFAANNAGFDAVLDATNVVIDLASGVVSVNGTTFELPTDVPEIPTNPNGNDWTLVVTGQVNGFAIPSTTINNLPAPTQSDIESQFIEQSLAQTPGVTCESISVNSVTNTDSRVVFTLSASCIINQQGVTVPYAYDLTYTYTR